MFDSLIQTAGSSLPALCLLLFLDGATTGAGTTPILLLSARHHEPWQVALAGGAASAAGSAVQLLVFRWMLGHQRPWMTRFLPSRAKIEATLAQYPSASFLAIAIARATPMPDAPLKLVAAVIGYPIWRYLLAVMLGALPYYWALAFVGKEFPLPPWVIGAIVGVIVLGFLVDLVRRRKA
ncbi:MAG: VTT domain-containing protein [Candidatus Eisenbacteria bacterium]